MKKIIITFLIAAFLTLPQSVFAEEVLLDRSLPKYDEQDAFPDNDYYGSYGVRGITSVGNGAFSYAEKDGNKMIKLSVEGSVESGYNYATLTMFVNRNHRDYYKKGMIISYDVIPPKNGKLVFHTYGANYFVSRRLYAIDNGVLIPAFAGNDAVDTAVLEENKMHNVKLVFDAVQKSYSIYLDGVKVGDTYQLADNYIKSEFVGEIPPMYLSLQTNDTTIEYPLECFIDNLKIISYVNDGIDIASEYDITDDSKPVVEFNPLSDKHSVGFDIFNNNTENSNITLASLKYKSNEAGYKSLDGYNIKKAVLTPVYNRVELSKMFIPENSADSSSKLLFMNSLYSPDIIGSMLSYANNGMSVTEVKDAATVQGIPAVGNVEATNLDREVIIKGHVEDAAALPLSGLPVGVVVLNVDKTKDEFISEVNAINGESNNIPSMIYLDASKTDSEGNYSFKLEMPENASLGDYLVISKIANAEYSTTMRYLTTAQKQTALDAVNNALDEDLDALNDALDDNKFALSLFVDYSSGEEMYNQIKNNNSFFDIIKSFGKYDSSEENVSDSILDFNLNLDKAILLAKLDAITDSAELANFMELNGKKIGLRLSPITQDNGNNIYQSITDLDAINSLEDINEFIAEQAVYYHVINAFSWGSIKTALENEAVYLNHNITDSTTDYSSVYHTLYTEKNSFSSYSSIIDRFNELITTCKIPAIPSTPQIPNVPAIPNISAGGGGGGGGGSVVTTPPVEEITDDQKETEENTFHFSDVSETHWAYNAIMELYTNGIVFGKTETEYDPTSFVKREEFIAMLVRAAQLELKDGIKEFADVSDSDWFKSVLDIAYSNGIINGRGNGTVGAGENITRQDIAVIISNMILKGFLEEKKEDSKYTNFTDIDTVSDYARSSVITIHKQKIISGYTEGDFRPMNSATRAEVAAIIQRILDKIKKD